MTTLAFSPGGRFLAVGSHDDKTLVVLEVQRDCVDAVQAEVVRLMNTTVELNVPLKVAAGTGHTWDEAH